MHDPGTTSGLDPDAKPAPVADTVKAPNPRIVVGFLAVIIAVQALYAGIEILGSGLDTSDPLRAVAWFAYFAYAALVGVFIVGVVRRMRWAWTLAVTLCAFGLSLTGLRLLAGEPVDTHMLAVLIDAGLLYYLFRPHIRAMFAV